jgi:glucosamine 6-phosphate synthetase-like amidotransferase/phosphosugar isomerase protein
MFKKTGRVIDYLGLIESLAHDATMLIGHCRYATHGDPKNNLNNHPHPCDGGWIVHNGQIRHHKDIVLGYGLSTHTDCDSEVFGLMIEESEGTLLERVTQSLTVCRGVRPISALGLWRNSLIAAKDNGQPLHCGESDSGYYLASLAEGLRDDCWNVQPFRDGEVICFGSHSLTENTGVYA